MALRSDSYQLIEEKSDSSVGTAADGECDLERDRDLVARCQSGDRSAFDALYIRYRRRLFRFCVQRLHESHEAEDVVQETFARAWRALPAFAGERRFYPWLTVIANNLCVDTMRRRARLTPTESSRLEAVDRGNYETEDAILQEVDSKMVAEAFGNLSDRHRRVLQLREGYGWSYQRIAEHEGVGVTAIETLLWRARQALKREFSSLLGPEGKVGALVGILALLPRRLFRKLPLPIQNMGDSVNHFLSSAGPLGVLGAPIAAVTGVLVIGAGTAAMMLPADGASTPSNPAVVPVTTPALAGTAGSSSTPSSAGGADPASGGTSSGTSSTGSSNPSAPGSSAGGSVAGGAPGPGAPGTLPKVPTLPVTGGLPTPDTLPNTLSTLPTTLSTLPTTLSTLPQTLSTLPSSLGSGLSSTGSAVTSGVGNLTSGLGNTATSVLNGLGGGLSGLGGKLQK